MKHRQKFMYATIVLLTLLQVISCVSKHQSSVYWEHDLKNVATPWTHERFDDASNRFSFAIISDLYGGYREGILEVAIDQLNLLRPEFVLSVGDLIDGGTENIIQLNKEWDAFENKIVKLKAPFFHVGGNHDLTNTTMREVWKERHGSRYYHFIYKNILFLILDSEDYSEERMQEIYKARAVAIEILDGDQPGEAVHSEYFKMPERRTGEIGTKQTEYFQKVIAENNQVEWTFILMHKPVWMRGDHEGLMEIEKVLQDRPYTVINGHFHTYNHTDRMGRDYITLGTTGSSQNDKSDMAFDHLMWVTIDSDGPIIANLKLEGILNKMGKIPADGENKCFQASECNQTNEGSH